MGPNRFHVFLQRNVKKLNKLSLILVLACGNILKFSIQTQIDYISACLAWKYSIICMLLYSKFFIN